jgi:hypothetical protein
MMFTTADLDSMAFTDGITLLFLADQERFRAVHLWICLLNSPQLGFSLHLLLRNPQM